jgi:hypothetical protein
MKVSILDDYDDTLRTLDCFEELKGHQVEIWTDHVQDVDTLAERLKDTEVLVLIRERTEIPAPLIRRLRQAQAHQPEKCLSAYIRIWCQVRSPIVPQQRGSCHQAETADYPFRREQSRPQYTTPETQ